jgi:hypothetical protein
MLAFIAGTVAGVVILLVVAISVAASSGTSRQPYGGTPTYHPSHQHVRLGAVSYDSDWQQTTLKRSLKMETATMYAEYSIEGSPDAVLQDQPFMAALAAGMLQASAYGYADRTDIGSGYSRAAIPSSTYYE